MRLTAGLLLVLGVLPSCPVYASNPRIRLVQLDASRCAAEGTLDLLVAELELEGVLRQRVATKYRLVLDGKLVTRGPARGMPLERAGRPLHLALIIENSISYEADLPSIKAGLKRLLALLPPRTRTTIIFYDWEVKRLVTLGGAQAALGAVEALEPSGEGVDLALAEAIKIGLRGLRQGGSGALGALVILSTGINASPKRDVFRALCRQAKAAQVPIHPVGFSPIDERGPLLNLGELAKQSGGMFRWARKIGDLKQQLENLAHQLSRQLLLTFEVDDHCAAAHAVQVQGGKLRSNMITLQGVGPEVAPSTTSNLKLIIFIGGLLLAMLALGLMTRSVIRASRKASGEK